MTEFNANVPPLQQQGANTSRAASNPKERAARLLGLFGYALGPASLMNYLGQLLLPHDFAARYHTLLDFTAFAITFLLLVNLQWKMVMAALPQILNLVFTLCLLYRFCGTLIGGRYRLLFNGAGIWWVRYKKNAPRRRIVT